MSLPNLRDLLDAHFSNDDLRQLCFDLGVEYENLAGSTRIGKAQSLIEYCLRHNRLSDLGRRCRELRPTISWPDVDTIAAEMETVQNAIAAQENLAGILPNDQLAGMLAPLHQKETVLLTQLLGSLVVAGDAVGGDKLAGDKIMGNKVIQHIVHIYREGGGRVSDEQLSRAIAKYASWVMDSYGRVLLRGLRDLEDEMPDPDLPDVYVSLAAQKEASRWQEREKEPQPVDMSGLLNQGHRLAITGAPGSGKTTFLRHIAYLLARALHTGDETPVRQQLDLDGPLPLPIYLSLGDYHRYRQSNGDGTLIDFISYTLFHQHGVYDLPKDFFAQMLSRDSTVCLLLDSLDEIPDEVGRFQASHAVMQLAANRSIGQMLVASRDHAYVGRTILPRPFRRFIVQPMRPEQTAALTKRWCSAVYPPLQAGTETKALQAEIEALEAIRARQKEAPLVDTPLMVTIVAIVHYNNRKLPQQRAALYEKCVNALLAEQHKGEEGQGQSQPDLEKRGGSLDAKRGYLALLAFEMMRSGADKEAGRSTGLSQMQTWLLPAYEQAEGAAAAPAKFDEFRRAMCDRASILHERGGRYEFTHLTFQEFLCAYYLAVNETPAAIAAFFQAEGRVQHSWWRETILLTIGYVGKSAAPQALKLAQELLDSFPDEAAGLAAAELAAAGLLELEIPAPDARQMARRRLTGLLIDPTQIGELALRALAGRTLSRLGDERRGVGVVEWDGLKIPDIWWGNEVPLGTYPYQQSTRKITQPFCLARYPITYAQFQCFIDAPDVADKRWWADMPTDAQEWGEQAFPYANHPRERVSWYQAVAFCRWLSAKLGEEIRLPHEYEWEVAARYPDSRSYPWGDEFDKEKANTNEGGIGQTTAVGLYPSGKNPALELYDLSGNVWEWCRNKYDDPDDDAVDESGAWRVRRGGSWLDLDYYARAAARPYPSPGYRGYGLGFRVVVVRRSPSHQ
jgi:energy-coupling factor transporter ATP-binding protein EcfA2